MPSKREVSEKSKCPENVLPTSSVQPNSLGGLKEKQCIPEAVSQEQPETNKENKHWLKKIWKKSKKKTAEKKKVKVAAF